MEIGSGKFSCFSLCIEEDDKNKVVNFSGKSAPTDKIVATPMGVNFILLDSNAGNKVYDGSQYIPVSNDLTGIIFCI